MAIKALPNDLLNLLTEHQRCLVKEYYSLQQTMSFPDETIHQRLCDIWKEAETDKTLCKKLELVDDLCNDLAGEDTEGENDSRAYLAEYLVPNLQVLLDQRSGKVPAMNIDDRVVSWLVECPSRDDQFTITLPTDNPQAMEQLKTLTCNRCYASFKDHTFYSSAAIAN